MGRMKRYFGQGVSQVVLFNWPMYVVALLSMVVGWYISGILPGVWSIAARVCVAGVALLVVVSLAVTFYAYDLTGLYELRWLNGDDMPDNGCLVNINAGFDETSVILAERFPGVELRVFDFYDPARHTEPSIERARRRFPAFPGTVRIESGTIPLPDGDAGAIFVLFAAHEIRDSAERTRFFIELRRVLGKGGHIYVLEHLRDLPNSIAYHLGVFHFHPRSEWERDFKAAGLKVDAEIRPNPFMHLYKLSTHGTSY